jgi:succinate---hydroxymethylglutarate CoA-transferase
VPYKGFKTSDGDIMLGGGNDRLFGILCERLGKPEWTKDGRFATNADRVKHRDELERLIEEVTATKTTQQWLEVMEASGMPYSAINDIQSTLNHEHGTYKSKVPESGDVCCFCNGGQLHILSLGN